MARCEMFGAVLVALWVARSFWWPGRYVVAFDTVAYSGPNYEITIDAWRRAALPLWNQYIFAGVTHLGNSQTGSLSPLRVIGLLADTNRAMGLTVALQLVIMAVGTVALLRRLGVRPPFALIGAIVMVGNGAVLTRTVQFEQIAVVAWIPLLLLAITSTVGRPERAWSAIAGLAATTALVLVAGHPQMQYMTIVVAGGYTIGLLWSNRRLRPMRAALVDLGIGVGLGVTAAALQLMAVAATVGEMRTSHQSLDELRAPFLSTPLKDLPRALLGSVTADDQVAFVGSFEGTAHLGVVGAVVAATGVFLLWRVCRPLAVALGGLAALGIVWAAGPRTPLFTIAHSVLPGFDLGRASSRWFTMTAISGAIAIGLGLEALRSQRTSESTPNRLWPVAAGAAGALAAVLALGAAGIIRLPDAVTLITWLGLTAGAVAVLLGLKNRRAALVLGLLLVIETAALARGAVIDDVTTSVPIDALAPGPAAALDSGLSVAFTDDDLGNPPYLVAGHRPNTNVLDRVASLDGYDGGLQITDRYDRLLASFASSAPRGLPLRNQVPIPLEPELGAELGLRWVLLDNDRDAGAIIPGWSRTRFVDDEFAVWENPRWTGDAVLSRADGGADALRFEQPTPERMVIAPGEAAAAAPGVVTVHRQFAPGWRATIDGQAAPVVELDGFWLGVEATGVQSWRSIELEYRPWWLVPGIAISVVGMFGILGVAGLGVRARRGAPRDPEGRPTRPNSAPRTP